MKIKSFALLLGLVVTFTSTLAQEQKADSIDEEEGYIFSMIKEVPSTSVKNQYRSSTCWSFSGVGLLESELLRMGKDTFDLSEMYVVRKVYEDKADKYIRFHGSVNFSGGGGFSDIIMVYDNYGLIPDEAYAGKVIGEENHIHSEMDAVLKAYVDAVMKNRNRKLTPIWLDGYNGVLDAYLGDLPETFTYNGTEYTAEGFADMLGLDPEDYVELTSYSHHQPYEEFILEIPDNWMHSTVYNLPLDEMIEVIDNALKNDYAVAWAADISDKGFSWKNGVAIVPEGELEDLTGTEKEKWEKLTSKEKQKALYSFDKPRKEKVVSPEMRQQAFDNYETTDDHGMLIVGLAEDQNNNKYYLVKNSWGTEDHIYDGYLYASDPFVRYKTMSIMVNKYGIPKDIRKKLGL